MTDVRWVELAAGQVDLVARWQLLEHASADEVEWLLRDHPEWRRVLDGVYATNLAPLTEQQRLRAATLTAPDSHLSHESAACWWGLRRRPTAALFVVRPGSGGAQQFGPVTVRRSLRLEGNVTTHRDVPLTTVERTIIDCAARRAPEGTARMVRDAIRLELTTVPRLAGVVHRHRGARGTALLRDLTRRYAPLHLERNQSDAESYAVELIAAAGLEVPDSNIRIAGEEADLIWWKHRRIVEIDGPNFHLFADEDARKTALWEADGWDVRRVSSEDVYRRPERLLALVPG